MCLNEQKEDVSLKVPGMQEMDSDKQVLPAWSWKEFLIWWSNRDVKEERIFGPNSGSFWSPWTDSSPPPWVHVGEMQHPDQVPL